MKKALFVVDNRDDILSMELRPLPLWFLSFSHYPYFRITFIVADSIKKNDVNILTQDLDNRYWQ